MNAMWPLQKSVVMDMVPQVSSIVSVAVVDCVPAAASGHALSC